MVCGLSCPLACDTLVPRPEIKPVSSSLEGGFSATEPSGKSPTLWFDGVSFLA